MSNASSTDDPPAPAISSAIANRRLTQFWIACAIHGHGDLIYFVNAHARGTDFVSSVSHRRLVNARSRLTKSFTVEQREGSQRRSKWREATHDELARRWSFLVLCVCV